MRHIIAKDESKNILGVIQLYLKRLVICYVMRTKNSYNFYRSFRDSIWTLLVLGDILTVMVCMCRHSYGEFIFYHSWADAYYDFGSRYYPKFQFYVPFTSVTGPTILVRNTSIRDQVVSIIVSSLKNLIVKVMNKSHYTSCNACLYHVFLITWNL